jgi:hypothetical protein
MWIFVFTTFVIKLPGQYKSRLQWPAQKKAARRGLQCGLAEEETRLVKKCLSRIRCGTSLKPTLSRSEIRLIVSVIRFVEPQDLCCPQTACGQHCPWEPTALHEIDQAALGRLLPPTRW